jgi:hypothetical protein
MALIFPADNIMNTIILSPFGVIAGLRVRSELLLFRNLKGASSLRANVAE